MSEVKSKIPFDHIVVTSPDQKAAEAALCGPLTKISCPSSTITSTCDPMNTRMGSGGGTIAALDHVSSSSKEKEKTVLIIHAGGESSRCPTQMSLGKAWTTIPCISDEMENPTSLLISSLSHLLQNIPTGSVIVAASDVLLSFHNTDSNNDLDESEPICFDKFKDQNIVLGVTVPAPISTATNHGVFVFKNDDDDDDKSKVRPISHFLQKPSIEELKQHCDNENAWVDTGVVIFLPKAAKMLRSMAQNQLTMCTRGGLEFMFQTQHGKQAENETCYELYAFAKKSTLRIELYSHFMLALSTDGDKPNNEDFSKRKTAYINDHLSVNKNEPNAALLGCIYDNFSKFELQACTVPNGKFIHLGTSLELMEFMMNGTTENTTAKSGGNHPSTKCHEFGQRIGLAKRSKTLLNFLKCSDSSVVCNTIVTNKYSIKDRKNYDSYHIIEEMSVMEHCALMVPPPTDHLYLEQKSDVPQSNNHHFRLKIGSNCLISGIRGTINETVSIPSNMCLQMIPLKTDWQRMNISSNDERLSTDQKSYYVYLYLSVLDNIKNCGTFYDIPFSDFLKYGQISIEDLWDTSSSDESQRTLWNAKLHPVITFSNDNNNNNNNNFDKIDFQWDHLEWVGLLKARVATADPIKSKREQKSFQKWMSLRRLSLSEIRSAADALKEFQYRDKISNKWFPFHLQLTNARLILEQRRHVSFSNELFNYCTSQNTEVSPYYISNDNLISVFRMIEDIACINIYERQYDISSRALMVLAGLFYDLNQHNTKLVGSIDDLSVLSNSAEQVKESIDKIQFLSSDDKSRTIACVNLFSIWNTDLFDQKISNSCNFYTLLRTCMNQLEEVASALTDLCCRSCSIDERKPFDKWVIASAPARVDLSGGWSDTPPISYEFGGAVACLAVQVNKKRPLLCRCRKLLGQKGVILSTESRNIETGMLEHENRVSLNKISDFSDFRNPNAACTLLKCALIYLGLVSLEDIFESNHNDDSQLLQCRLRNFCASENDLGLEIISTSLLPLGSGMGSSSILSGCILSSIATCVEVDMMGRRVVKRVNDNEKTFSYVDLTHAVLAVEQLLTTGGGWQDQIGGLIGGLKLGKSQNNQVPLEISVKRGIISDDVAKILNERIHLVYTGTPRLAKNILQNVLHRWARRSPEIVETVGNLVEGAADAFDAFESGDISRLGKLMSAYWDHKKIMAGNCSEPDCVRDALQSFQREELIHGGTLAGAGGGGFLVLLSREGVSSQKLKQVLKMVDNPLSNLGTWYECTIDMDGLRVWPLMNSTSNESYDISWHM